jgi:hypothetical protein
MGSVMRKIRGLSAAALLLAAAMGGCQTASGDRCAGAASPEEYEACRTRAPTYGVLALGVVVFGAAAVAGVASQ